MGRRWIKFVCHKHYYDRRRTVNKKIRSAEFGLGGCDQANGVTMTRAYRHRTAFGCWINDMRNKDLPHENWPYENLDDQAVEDIIGCLELQKQAGFNEFDVFGLITTRSWPLDVRRAVDEGRRRQVNKVLKAAHKYGIKTLYGLGVYSWGFDRIIESCPGVRTPSNPLAMCGSKSESWRWMQKVIDFILSEFEIDGFHLEASDQGRCDCPTCAKQGYVEYFSRLNRMTAEYIRSKRPDKILMVNMCGYIRPAYKKVKTPDMKYLVDLSRHLDYIIDPGHFGNFIPEKSRKSFIRSLHCDYGTSGGFWVYPPQRWNRLRWFLPHTIRTAQHLKQLYKDGGRAAELFMGPTINPGVEMNIAFGGKLMSDVGKDTEKVLVEAVDMLYRPKSCAAGAGLVDVFQRAEKAYFDNWTPNEILESETKSIPGELHPMFPPPWVESPRDAPPGHAAYLRKPYMNSTGRLAYKKELISILSDIGKIESGIADKGRVKRIKACVKNTIKDMEIKQDRKLI